MIEKTDRMRYSEHNEPNKPGGFLGFCVLKIYKTIYLIEVNGVATIEKIK